MDERWVRSPAWELRLIEADTGASPGDGPHLVASAGADESYWVDEAPPGEAARRLHAAWLADRADALRDDADCGAAVRQLRRVGALVPQGGAAPVRSFVLRWWGEPALAWQAELDRQLADTAPTLRRIQGDGDGTADAVWVIVRTTADWDTALPPYCADFPTRPHVLIDLAYHHSVVVGPWVVPGQTACLACLGTRTVRRWGDAPVPPRPLALAHAPLSAALLLQVLRGAAEPGGHAPWIEHSTHLDLRSLQSQRARIYRQPWCPACSGHADVGCAAERMDGRVV
ncbi:MAG: TOMM precursor leader peptide-binding protein [Acidovorax sp.]|uniref:TOMM precursor leader peptide-binding protein n=1 Tax=Acidovorax sp. TaxID=1872122 RepID=UPI0039E2B4A5